MSRSMWRCPHCGRILTGYRVDIMERYSEHVSECEEALSAAMENEGNVGELSEMDAWSPSNVDPDALDGMTFDEAYAYDAEVGEGADDDADDVSDWRH